MSATSPTSQHGRTVAVIQARMSSQRLPGKVLAPLPARDDEGLRVIDWVVGRVRRCRSIAAVVVATSDAGPDDLLAQHCADRGIDCFRGALEDVLDRFHGAARHAGADTVVRVTGDCPLVDPDIIESVLDVHRAEGADFTGNRLPPPDVRSYPIGLDVEVAQAAALERAWHEATAPADREHVMPYLYSTPGRFRTAAAPSSTDDGAVRWTVDTPEDLEAVRALLRLAGAGLGTGWRELLAVWQAHPELAAINSTVTQRTGTDVDPRTRQGGDHT